MSAQRRCCWTWNAKQIVKKSRTKSAGKLLYNIFSHFHITQALPYNA
jgi:hypothetical protein